ncbi:MAG: hypothetical protein ACK4UN_16670 [Limisphaerales bacterium]
MKQESCLTNPKGRLFQLTILFFVFSLLVSTTACRTVPEFATVDFTQVGWKSKSGQAVWKVNHEAPEIAGDVLFATNQEGRVALQMTKTPFPMVVAQLQGNKWQIEFPTENRRYSGRGEPHRRLAWLHLAKALRGDPVASPWTFQRIDAESWKLENPRTGEVIEGFLQ